MLSSSSSPPSSSSNIHFPSFFSLFSFLFFLSNPVNNDMKTKAFSSHTTLLASLLSCAFLLFFVWRHDFSSSLSSLHLPTTVTSASVPNHHDQEDDSQPLRPPSVDYIDLASNHQFPSRPYDVYPDYKARGWRQRLHGSRQPCLGPRGVNVNNNPGDMIEAWSLRDSDGGCGILCVAC